MSKILIIDDDRAIAHTLKLHLKESAHEIRAEHDLRSAEEGWRSFAPDLVILDLKLPDGDGIDLLKKRRDGGDLTPVILITGHHEMEHAIEAMQAGAHEFIHKPLDLDELDAVVNRTLDQIESGRSLEPSAPDPRSNLRIAGISKAILEVHKQIGLAARSGVSVLISGETGTGKELVARAVHSHATPDKPFVAVNCSALVPSLVESELFGHERGAFTGAHQRQDGKLTAAGEGTLFLDEIGDLEYDLQAKLLRVLQERTFSRVGGHEELSFRARVIAATNRDLRKLMNAGKFREDLYFRLNVFQIKIPPLRERPEDIPIIAGVLLEKISQELHAQVSQISDADMMPLVRYHWPGNVRELENVLMQSVIHSPGKVLNLIFHPEPPQSEPEARRRLMSLAELEREHILYVLKSCEGHLGKACEVLGISRPTLRKKLSDYDVKFTEN